MTIVAKIEVDIFSLETSLIELLKMIIINRAILQIDLQERIGKLPQKCKSSSLKN